MMSWTQQVAAWWLDYFVLASVLLALALVAGGLIRQPVQRMAIAWSAIIGLLALAVCCVVPGWPRFALVSSNDAATESELPDSGFVTAEGLMGTLKPEKLLSTRPKPADGVEVIAVDDGDTTKWAELRAPQRSAKFKFARLVPWMLLSGSMLTAAWLILGLLRASRLCRRAAPAPEFALNELRALVGSHARPARLLIGETISTAGAIGLWRPTILLPAEAVQSGEADAALRAQLAHEWAHIERGDLWLLALGRVLLVVLYMHPLFWLLRWRILADQELLADAAAADYCGRHKYAETLVAWARHRPRGGTRLRWALGIWERPSQLSRRIAMLLNERIRLRMTCSRGWRVSNVCAIACLVGGLSLLSVNPARVTVAATKDEGPDAKPAAELKTEAKAQAVEVTGTCVDEKQKPVAGAHVRLIRVDHSDRIQSPPQGRFKVTLVGSNPEETKSLMAGSSTGWGDGASQRLFGETKTDAKGKFRFANVPTDDDWLTQKANHWVVVQAPGKGTQVGCAFLSEEKPKGKRTSGDVNITMEKAATIRGRITNAQGQPVAGATVWGGNIAQIAKPIPGIVCAVTDADGRYEITDMSPADIDDLPPMAMPFGRWQMESFILTADHPDYAPGIIEYTKVPSTADHVLQRPAHVHGRVTLDESGKTDEKTGVHWTHESGLSDSVFTDAKGNYSIPRLLPGKYKVVAECKGRLADSRDVTVPAGDYRLDMQMRIGGTLKGRVVDDATGKAPTFDRRYGIEVRAFLASAGNPLNRKSAAVITGYDSMMLCSGWVNDDGTFTATIEPGRNLLRFDNPQWQLTDADRWSKKGVDIAKGQTVEVELRVSARRGGWASLFAQAKQEEAEAKGEPAPPPPPPPELEEVELDGTANEELRSMRHMERMFTGWSDDAMPKEPMSVKATLNMLKAFGAAGEETIDGEKCLTAVMFHDSMEFFQADEQMMQLVWLERSILAHIDQFPHLGSLMLMGAPGDDSWFKPLRGHKELQCLQICYPKKLTPAGMEHLATLPKLKMLVLCGSGIGDDVVAATSRLPNLECLQFYCAVSDEGLSHLQGNSKLKMLAVGSNVMPKTTDKSLRYVGTISNLEQLDIGNVMGDTRFTDDGLKHLAGLTKLQELTIRGTHITDAGLVHLQGLKNLKKLNVNDTSVSPQGVNELRKHLPGCDVNFKIRDQPVRAAKEGATTERR